MPFLGVLNDETVLPEEVEDGVTVRCSECDGEMAPRGPFEDGRARHFYHITSDGGCDGGESDTHQKLKSIAVSTLKHRFPDHARCEVERTLDTTNTETLPDTRRADALLEFPTSNRFYGHGIIIEIQYRNHGKDLYATTHDYLNLNYSVYWATPADFDTDRLDFDPIEQKFNQQEDDAYAVYHHDPGEFSTELAASLDWEHPTPDCDHDWEDMLDATPQYESCPHCQTNRIYNRDHARYLYDSNTILGPTADPPQSATDSAPDSTSSSGSHDHVWEPLGDGVYRCYHCSARKVELNEQWGGETATITLDMSYMGADLTELTRNPEHCTHDWSSHRDKYQCQQCGLIKRQPW